MACNGYTRKTMTSQTRGCPPTTNTYTHCGDGAGAPCRDMYATATQERGDMQGLNDRLAGYLQRLQGLQQQPQVDPAKYREAMQLIENEMIKLKRDYEGELDRLRNKLEECCREKSSITLSVEKNGANMADLQAKVSDLQGQLQRALADNQDCCARLANKDKELADMACRLKGCQSKLETLAPDYSKLRTDAADCKKRLECELKAKVEYECRVQQMLDKLQFDNSNKDKKIVDLQDRLKATNDIISTLEVKIRQLSANDGEDLGALLLKIREGTAVEIRRQQKSTEEAVNKALMSLTCQINTDAKDKDALFEEKGKLQELVQQMQSKLGELEGKLTATCTENQTLRSELDRERTCSQQQIRSLEQKLRELHAQMMAKIKECGEARDQQVSLNAEITNYRSLLDVVEAKSKNVGATTMTVAKATGDRSALSEGYGRRLLPAVTARKNMNDGASAAFTMNAAYCGSRRAANWCAPMTPADVLGKTLGGSSGEACCGNCAAGGPCATGHSAPSLRPTQRITTDFKPGSAGVGCGAHSRSLGVRSHISGGRQW